MRCTKCKTDKQLHDFGKFSRNRSGYDTYCKACRNAHNKNYRETHKEAYCQTRKAAYLRKIEHMRAEKRAYGAKHREEKRAYDAVYRKVNAKKVAATKRRCELRHKDDPLQKIKRNMRRRLIHVLRGNLRATNTFNLVGCTADQLKKWLEAQFTEGMSWSNYGLRGWHIDHRVQCCEFDMRQEAEQRACFHYTNLRPMWASLNTSRKFNEPRS